MGTYFDITPMEYSERDEVAQGGGTMEESPSKMLVVSTRYWAATHWLTGVADLRRSQWMIVTPLCALDSVRRLLRGVHKPTVVLGFGHQRIEPEVVEEIYRTSPKVIRGLYSPTIGFSFPKNWLILKVPDE